MLYLKACTPSTYFLRGSVKKTFKSDDFCCVSQSLQSKSYKAIVCVRIVIVPCFSKMQISGVKVLLLAGFPQRPRFCGTGAVGPGGFLFVCAREGGEGRGNMKSPLPVLMQEYLPICIKNLYM